MQHLRLTGRSVLVAGGAGFIGSHLCEALLMKGNKVICVDSFVSGRFENVSGLSNHPNFTLIAADVTSMPPLEGVLSQIYNLASVASPPQYQADPVHTMLTNVRGTHNLLELARQHGAAEPDLLAGDRLAVPAGADESHRIARR